MSPNQTVLFPITIESINEMLQFHSSQALTPIFIGHLLEKSTKMSQSELEHLCQTFILNQYQTKDPPPYMQFFLIDMGKIIVDMISVVMGFNTSEYVDELTLVLLSIFTLGQPRTIKYDCALFIVDKIHDQFMRLENERVFKFSTFIYHLILYYQSDKFPFSVMKLDAKVNPRSYFGPPSSIDLFPVEIATR